MSLLAERSDRKDAGVRAHARAPPLAGVTLSALGVVYGDIGTSPLYAMTRSSSRRARAHARAGARGGFARRSGRSRIVVAVQIRRFWSCAPQNDGEGGVFALYGLLHDFANRRARLLLLGVDAGRRAAVRRRDDHAGDQRALRGRGARRSPPRLRALRHRRSRSALSPCLFAIQFKGTSGVGRVFGPI